MSKVLVIDDDRTVRHLVGQAFKDSDIEVIATGTATEGLEVVRTQQPDAVLLDIVLPEASGLEIFHQIHAIDSRLPVIFITGGGTSDTAIEAMMLGAYDYVLKPLDLGRLQALIKRALETRRMMHVPISLPTADESPISGETLVGRSAPMLEVYKAIARVAPQDITVLITGQSGTGKELVARAVYQHSSRANAAFLAVNCAAIPDNLLESELFGHEKGAFTSADQRRIGKFEQCSGGTIFLDEVGDMSPLVQGKVLRLLQQQQFERVGGNKTITTDVRIVAATNRDLETMVEDGEFRADLYYRLNDFSIELPRLVDRGSDILLLLEHYVAQYTKEMGRKDIQGLAADAVNQLMQYDWPGNIRELQSVVRQTLLNTKGPVVVPEFLPPEIRGDRCSTTTAAATGGEIPSAADLQSFVNQKLRTGSKDLYAETVDMAERYLFTRVLQDTGGNQTRAAEILGITRGKIRDRIAAFNISLEQTVSIENGTSGDD